MTLASWSLLLLMLGLVVFDLLASAGKNRRALLLQVVVFLTGAFFVVFPSYATTLAHAAGIGRGVDFLMYPVVIWLARESLLARRRRVEDSQKITALTRALALATADHRDTPRVAPRP